MAVAVASYSHEHFKSIPSLNEALTNFHQKDSTKLVDGIFKDLFIKNGIDHVFGLSIPHRYFDIEPSMKLVSYNGYAKGEAFEIGEKGLAFIDTFKTILNSQSLRQLFGLCLYPRDDFMGSCEVTWGLVDVNLEPKDSPDGMVRAETVWFFSPQLTKRGCKCTYNNRENPHGHGTHVDTVNG